jgi:hypothetical protein
MAFSVSPDDASAVRAFLAERAERFVTELKLAYVEHYGPQVVVVLNSQNFCEGCEHNKIYTHKSHSCFQSLSNTFKNNIENLIKHIPAPMCDRLWAEFVDIVVASDMPRDQAIRWVAIFQSAEEAIFKVKDEMISWLDKHHPYEGPLY